MELTITNIKKQYGQKTALSDFSYSFHEGIYGILGANGAGKSTLLNLITDNIKRDEGTISFNGTDILRLGAAYRAVLGYMPQQQGLYDSMTVESFLAYLACLKKISGKAIRGEITRVLELTGLVRARHDRIRSLSGGMKQRVLLAQAMLGNPQILLLDEPTAGLDPKERIRLRNHIYTLAQDRIVLLATHIVSDIEAIAGDILLLKGGKLLCSGSPQTLLSSLPSKAKPIAGNHYTLEDVYLYYLGDDGDE